MRTAFKLKVLTPMFMGGADPQGKPELRAASIRGAMRFWFRAMAGTVTDDPREIYRLESEIFGNTERKSKVVVRVRKDMENFNISDNGDTVANWTSYLANVGLARSGKGFVRKAIAPDSTFLVELIESGFAKGLASKILEIAVYFGGFGARWRHGFGSCEIVEINGKSIDGFDLSIIEETITQIKEFAKQLGIITKPVDKLPDFPSFARFYHQIWEGERTKERNWDSLLSYIGEAYRKFRINDGNNFGRHGHTRDFLDIIQPIFEAKKIKSNNPRNDIFGLPIQFSKQYGKGKNKHRKTAVINVFEKETNRRASPLILHIEPENGLIRATLFKSKFLPDKANYTVDKRPYLKLRKPNENDFRRVEQFLQSLGLTRRYPNA